MRPTPYHREVIAWLEGHGAERVRLVPGAGRTSHPRLSYLWHGEPQQELVAATPSDPQAVIVKIQTLRRKLGDPPEVARAAREKRRLEDMMPGVAYFPPKPADADGRDEPLRYRGAVARYDKVIKFKLPNSIIDFLGDRAVVMTSTGPDEWSLLPDAAAGKKAPRVQSTGQRPPPPTGSSR